MSHRNEVWDPIWDIVGSAEEANLILDAIPSLTLKTEDGRFVKVEQATWTDGRPMTNSGRPMYRIVEDPNE